jgi:hypothetical protein
MRLGDMEVVGELPPKLMKACAIISSALHAEFDRTGWIEPGHSKVSCVLCALTVRDFLRRIGFRRAEVRSVYLMIRSFAGNEETWSIGVGDHEAVARNLPWWAEGRKNRTFSDADSNGWDGHLVAWEPDSNTIIDTTVYQAIRPQWSEFPGMLAIELAKTEPIYGHRVLAGLTGEQDDGTEVHAFWLDQNSNDGWRSAPDREHERRLKTVKRLVERFGKWR